MDRAADGAWRLGYLRRHSWAGPVPGRGNGHCRVAPRPGCAQLLSHWDSSCPSASHPASTRHGGIGTIPMLAPPDQPRSASAAFTEAAERSLKLKGREFPESQGKTHNDLPQPQRHNHLLDRGTSRPRLCVWSGHFLMLVFMQPQSNKTVKERFLARREK